MKDKYGVYRIPGQGLVVIIQWPYRHYQGVIISAVIVSAVLATKGEP